MIHNNKVYANADEKFVKGTIIYSNEDRTLFYDSEFKKPVMNPDLEDIFLNGAVVGIANGYFTPVSYKISGSKVGLEDRSGAFHVATAPAEE